MSLNCVIIDDEKLAIQLIETYLKKYEQFVVVKTFTDPVLALDFICSEQAPSIDVVFLDIEMGDITGLEFLTILPSKPLIVFTTAHAEYAVKGFELDIIDYLLKPITFVRFSKTISKILNSQSGNDITNEKSYTYFKYYSDYIRVDFSDILFVKSQRDIIKLKLTNKQLILSDYTMKLFEAKLPANQFVRVHKSYIIALSKIKTVKGGTVEIGGEFIPIGDAYKHDFFSKVKMDLF